MPGAKLAGAPGSRSLWLVAALCGAFAALHLTAYLSAAAGRDEPLFGDFFAFWSFARFLSDAPPAAIYDIARLTAYQQALDPRFQGFYPFPYPPLFALLLRPLAPLGYLSAYAAWIGTGFAAYLAVASRAGPAGLALAALAPATTTALIAGQNGFLTAALLGGGLALLPARPALAGALLGALAYKPHLLPLVPLALLAARQWRALAAMAAAAAALAGLSALVFGAAMWRAWLAGMPDYLAAFAQHRDHLLRFMPTVTAALWQAGAPEMLAQAVQLACAAAAAWAVWRAFRRGPSPEAAALLPVACFVATPYAFVYDLPVVTLSIAIAWPRLPSPWRLLLLPGLALPVLPLLAPLRFAAMPVILLLLLAVIAGLDRRDATEHAA